MKLRRKWKAVFIHSKQIPTQNSSTLWLLNIAMENGPFIAGLPVKNGDCV